jgi:hypothetical protein
VHGGGRSVETSEGVLSRGAADRPPLSVSRPRGQVGDATTRHTRSGRSSRCCPWRTCSHIGQGSRSAARSCRNRRCQYSSSSDMRLSGDHVDVRHSADVATRRRERDRIHRVDGVQARRHAGSLSPRWQQQDKAASTTGPDQQARLRSFAPRPPLPPDSCLLPCRRGPRVACAAHADLGRVDQSIPSGRPHSPRPSNSALDRRPWMRGRIAVGYLRTMGR